MKDDDYRLSFLYGNFTTLTRFTELDLERVVDERLGPLFVSIHATDPDVRAEMLRNPKGATSLRWLRVLLDVGIEVHGQVVVCPGVNDGPVLDGHVHRHPRRVRRPGHCRRRPARAEPVLIGTDDAAAHRRRGRRGLSTGRGAGRRSTSPSSAAASSTRRTSTTSWPGGRCRRPATTTGSRSTRTGSEWSGRSSGRSAATGRPSTASGPASSPRSTARRRPATGRRGSPADRAVGGAVAGGATGTVAHR